MNEKPFVILGDILDLELYKTSLEAGHIRTQTHPTLPFVVHNYTEACTWENGWNDVTMMCRGLITNAETGEVLARPLKKFFNHDQLGAPTIGLDDPISVTDKIDGSMAVLFPVREGSYAISTRGSFASDQAIWATKFWNRNHAGSFIPNPEWTYIFEIIYPDNRIVVNYGSLEALVLLGAIDIATGKDISLEDASRGWNGPVVEIFPHRTFREVLEAPIRDNAEGFVIYHFATSTRVKIKYDEYKRLHRLMTGTSPKDVWKSISLGEDPNIVFASAPDEFHVWLRAIIADLQGRFDSAYMEANEAFRVIQATMPAGAGRREWALAIMPHPLKALLFLLLDNRSIDEAIWKTLKPFGTAGMRKSGNETGESFEQE